MGWKFGNSKRIGKSGSEKSGGGCLILFGLVFGGIGLMVFLFAARQFFSEAETYGWTETPCEIVRCEIQVEANREDDPFQLVVDYRYQFEGRRFESNQVALQTQRTDDYEKLALKRRGILEDRELFCYVNPDNPSQAVIERRALTSGLFMLFPLLFVAIGGFIIWGGVGGLKKGKAIEKAGRKAAISSGGSTSKSTGRKVGIAFGAIFALIGLGVGIGMGNGPIKRMVMSRHWVETPCQIIWSRVQSHDSDDGTTYSVDIFYEYQFGGETHRSNRYESMSGSSSGRSGKVTITRRYPKGSQQVCFVNPDQPEQAVLVKGITAWVFFMALPLVFLLVGIGVLVGSLRQHPSAGGGPSKGANGRHAALANRLASTGSSPHLNAEPVAGGPMTLRPGKKRLLACLGMLLVALFWNGIISVFLVELVKGWRTGHGDWFQTLFMIPFVAIGVGLLGGFFYQLMAATNPRPIITLSSGNPALGDSFDLSWTFSGGVSRVVQLKISLWGIESATYRRGTTTATSSEVFFHLPLAEGTAESEIRCGTVRVTIPEDLMYSLKLGNNEIKYELRVDADIPLWPDIRDHFDLTLLPR
ncbi:MAG: DUF3592 domain-containing protein, partial [Verrucomicrobiae bacterium]|nr:DUF3592 domain-containing protein [Verrucomicrobiae bacterium]